MSKIFISHASRDNAYALAIQQWLVERGWGRDEIFLDIDPEQGISVGENWRDALTRASDRCEAVVFLVSQAWIASRWCEVEFNTARALHKKMFAVLIDDARIDEIPAYMGAEWQLASLVGEPATAIEAGLPPKVPVSTVRLATVGLRSLEAGLRKAGLDPTRFAWPPAGEPGRSPYRGLAPLEEADAAVYFGREAEIVRGMDTLRGLRSEVAADALIILGASGSGKSSFLRAGLLPRLARDEALFLPVAPLRAAYGAISGDLGLASALAGAFAALGRPERTRGALLATLTDADDGFGRLIGALREAAVARLPEGSRPPVVVLSIDQAEELYQRDAGAGAMAQRRLDEARTLRRWLAAFLHRGSSGVGTGALILVLTIRSNNYDDLQTDPDLGGVLAQTQSLAPLAREQYGDIIRRPAETSTLAGRPLQLDDTLVNALINDIQGEGSDGLPLLALTLAQLHRDYAGDGNLTLAEYRQFGGVRSAVEHAVAAAVADPNALPPIDADPAARDDALRRTFVPWLVEIDDRTLLPRRRVARHDELPAAALPYVQRLADARLLVIDMRHIDDADVQVVEVTHEAVLRQWTALAGWLTTEALDLRALTEVAAESGKWDRDRRIGSRLTHFGDRLDAAQRLVAQRADFAARLGAVGAAYLHACRERQDAETAAMEAARREAEAARNRELAAKTLSLRRLRRFSLALAVTGVTSIGAAAWGWISYRSADLERTSAVTMMTRFAYGLRGHMDRVARLGLAEAVTQPLAEYFERYPPEDVERRRIRATVLMTLGEIAIGHGELDEARRRADQAVAVTRQLHEIAPTDRQALRDHGVARDLLARVLELGGDLRGALALRRDDLAVWERLQNEADGELRGLATRDHLGQLIQLSQLASRVGAPEARLPPEQSTLALAERALTETYANPGEDPRELLLVGHGTKASALADLGRHQEALHHFTSASKLAESLWDERRFDMPRREAFARSLGQIAEIQEELGDLEAAVAGFQRFAGHLADLMDYDPDNRFWRADHALGRGRAAEVLRRLGRTAEAAPLVAQYREESAALADAHPGVVAWQGQKADALRLAAAVLLAQGQAAQAEDPAQAAVAIYDRLGAENRLGADGLRDRAEAEAVRAEVARARGDGVLARRHAERAVAGMARAVAARPGKTSWRERWQALQGWLRDPPAPAG